jgi:phytoene synthase
MTDSQKIERDAFRQSSATYYASSKFLPKQERDYLFKMYSFTGLARSYASDPKGRLKFERLRKRWDKAKLDDSFDTTVGDSASLDTIAVKNMVALTRKYSLDLAWIEAFLNSMQQDQDGKVYETWDDTLDYIYGSAEIIALIICRIMNTDPAAYEHARMEARAMQLVDFIRNIADDAARGRCYIPKNELKNFGLNDLTKETATANKDAFEKCIRRQIRRYEAWQLEASKGETFVPRKYRVTIVTAVDMCNWMAASISRDPMAVYARKVKPAKNRMLVTGLTNMLSL